MNLSDLIQSFSINNLSLRPAACKYLNSTILSNHNLSEIQIKTNIDKILSRLTNLDGSDSDFKLKTPGFVDEDDLVQVIKELEGKKQSKENTPFVMVDIFKDCKRFVYWVWGVYI